ncbi:MAG TPA: HIT family protein [Methylocella sp.]|nr:HIT family protein [Methylocella sp.]
MPTTGYDENNIFAKILRGEIPCYKVYEDDATLAFMDLMPQSDGHVLVLPKSPSRNLLDADPRVLAPLIARVQMIARAVKEAMAAEGITIVQYNGDAAGQTVFHLHFHIIPRWSNVAVRAHGRGQEKAEVLEGFRQKIADAIKPG